MRSLSEQNSAVWEEVGNCTPWFGCTFLVLWHDCVVAVVVVYFSYRGLPLHGNDQLMHISIIAKELLSFLQYFSDGGGQSLCGTKPERA